MRVLGIDQSLTETGFAYWNDGEMVTGRVKPRANIRGLARLFMIRTQLMKVVEEFDPTLIVMEGYAMSFGKGKSKSHSLGELGGVLKLAFWEEGYPLLIVPPKSMKALIALNGAAEKERVRKSLALYYGLNIRNLNEVDAAGLCLVGEAHAGTRLLHGFTGERMDTLRKCESIPGRQQIGRL